VALLLVPISCELGIGSVVQAAWKLPADDAAATGGCVQLLVAGHSAEGIKQAPLSELEAKGFSDNQVNVKSETKRDSVQVTHIELQSSVPGEGATGDSTVIETIIVDQGQEQRPASARFRAALRV
jgi:hypothetical protein